MGLNVCVEYEVWRLLAWGGSEFDHKMFIRRIAKIFWSREELLKRCTNIRLVRDPANRVEYEPVKVQALKGKLRNPN